MNRPGQFPAPDDSGSIDFGGRRAEADAEDEYTLPTTAAGTGSLLKSLLAAGLIHPVDWENTTAAAHDELGHAEKATELLAGLVALRLLTAYQAQELRTGPLQRLVMGNYRILDRLGAGGGGIVYLAQHFRLRRVVALKVLVETRDLEPQALLRFLSEIDAVGQLQHPNIVAALDAGEIPRSGPGGAKIHYLAMEYVPGRDLVGYIGEVGPLEPAAACDLVSQAARGLAEAHRHQLIHRDVKPSNVLVTLDKQVKLLDFGLARRFGSQLTQPGIPLGTLDYMAPEQVRDASAVDPRTDVYGLGGTLFWCLTGKTPFPPTGSTVEKMLRRLSAKAPSVRGVRTDLSAELDAVVARMLAPAPDDRYATMDAVLSALTPFLESTRPAPIVQKPGPATAPAAPAQDGPMRVLVVDDDPFTARMSQQILQTDQIRCDLAPDGPQALALAAGSPYDLVVLDIQMPGMSGADVLQVLRKTPPTENLKIIMCSGAAHPDEMAEMMLAGADDYVTKPVSPVQLKSRVGAALTLKAAQDRTDALNRQLRAVNASLGRDVVDRDSSLLHARNALVLALAKLVESRTQDTGARLQRLQRYCTCLAESAAGTPEFATQIDPEFTRLLEACAPLHDVGKVALPDYILLKPGKLELEERLIMQTHTTVGSDTFRQVAERYAFSRPFLQMAVDVARHHHERWDGAGYPDRLAAAAIPLAARILTFGDVYDALRCRRPYRPAMTHLLALRFLDEALAGQFDPQLQRVFNRCTDQFERIFREGVDG